MTPCMLHRALLAGDAHQGLRTVFVPFSAATVDCAKVHSGGRIFKSFPPILPDTSDRHRNHVLIAIGLEALRPEGASRNSPCLRSTLPSLPIEVLLCAVVKAKHSTQNRQRIAANHCIISVTDCRRTRDDYAGATSTPIIPC